MSDIITIVGTVGTDPHHFQKGDLAITTFRLASNQGHYGRATNEWRKGESNWFSVTAFRELAANSGTSLRKGQRVIVRGSLKVRQWETGERKGTSVDLEAQAIGHDLSRGISVFTPVFTGADGRQTADDAERRIGAEDLDGAEDLVDAEGLIEADDPAGADDPNRDPIGAGQPVAAGRAVGSDWGAYGADAETGELAATF